MAGTAQLHLSDDRSAVQGTRLRAGRGAAQGELP